MAYEHPVWLCEVIVMIYQIWGISTFERKMMLILCTVLKFIIAEY